MFGAVFLSGGSFLGMVPVAFPRDGYQGDYITDIAARLLEEEEESLLDEPGDGRFREAAEQTIFAGIRATLDAIDIAFDVFFNESGLYEDGKLEQTLAELRETGLVYEGDGAVWLKATGPAKNELGIDYPVYRVRGHYTRSEALRRYFRTYLFLSQPPIGDPLEVTLLTALFGLLDEYHQSFVPGRNPALGDALADLAGGLLGALFMFLLARRAAHKLRSSSYESGV